MLHAVRFPLLPARCSLPAAPCPLLGLFTLTSGKKEEEKHSHPSNSYCYSYLLKVMQRSSERAAWRPSSERPSPTKGVSRAGQPRRREPNARTKHQAPKAPRLKSITHQKGITHQNHHASKAPSIESSKHQKHHASKPSSMKSNQASSLKSIRIDDRAEGSTKCWMYSGSLS